MTAPDPAAAALREVLALCVAAETVHAVTSPYNRPPAPYVWTKTVREVIAEALADVGAGVPR
jgi:hypothetical protein